MQQLLLLFLTVGTILGIQWSGRYWTQARLKKNWTIACAAVEREEFGLAETALARCVRLAPLWVHARVYLASVQGRMGKTEEAEKGLLETRALHPKEPEPHLGLGMLYATAMEGKDSEAIGAFEKAIALDAAVAEVLIKDPRLARLRSEPRFAALLGNTAQKNPISQD